ncbi:superoxide dismutase family protein [Phytoactinopolyspora limicola]|uniref:superoxide dismutase family protein n=1 Tax=Phytoactinopolyspora limicola TaxID=2715536 RepID=UPI00140D6D38|nr:superoxide dismutase family protein [Phytoactinopolyspora limicola]
MSILTFARCGGPILSTVAICPTVAPIVEFLVPPLRLLRLFPATALAGALLASAGCGGNTDTSATADELESIVNAEFNEDPAESDAVTYDPSAVPAGAPVQVTVAPADPGGTTYTLHIEDVEPARDFGAHLHTGACGPDPADAGPHYQNSLDPVQPSTDPAYANPDNEVWLDLTTDDDGAGSAEATVRWTPREGEANSIVIHEHHTMTDPGHAGHAGDRLACVDLP